MKKIILAIALLVSTNVANANNTINKHSRFVDVKLGYTSIAANSTINTIDKNYSFSAERTHILLALSDDNNIYLGVNAGIEIHTDSFYKFSNSSTDLDFTTYSAHLAPSIYFSPIERVKLFSTLGVSYNILRTASDEGVLPINVKGSGFGYIYSFGGKYSVSDNFDIGLQYQINPTTLKYDEISDEARNRISNAYKFSSLYISAGYKF